MGLSNKHHPYYAPNFEKVEGHIALGLSCPSVLPSDRLLQIKDRALKFYRWIPHQKITDPYFFLIWIISLCGVMPLFKGQNEIL